MSNKITEYISSFTTSEPDSNVFVDIDVETILSYQYLLDIASKDFSDKPCTAWISGMTPIS
jgi:hypothetical protein